MTLRMLIDARHREETRVAVVKGNRIEEFDFESAEHKQLKGNIYLAKVTRVEPSLQAAFVDYGGNRHGFLAFSEIHPDYYQIPREDREALLAEEAQHAAEEAALRDEDEEEHGPGAPVVGGEADMDGGVEEIARPLTERDEAGEEGEDEDAGDASGPPTGGRGGNAADEVRRKRMALRRRYKIQDVIKRRQVLLVQVVKEERGNKGAALTSYLSLAGRYCVLMPNTSHGGGISRKISSVADRKRLKSIMAELELPKSMGCIVRTAGLQRTRTEIKRDFDYLARLWDEIRDTTLRSSAPALVHNDSDLIKRAIRDIYHRDIEEVVVEGEEGYRAAKDFMKLLMPSHARRVKQYADTVSLFQRHGVEDQLAAMYHPVVQLKSGGYLVINPTEALVSIDINSGRSTREHNIEQTALSTNLEAAREIARQLRLRDMAGLIVIDFIDMDHGSNVRKVEKAMKEALKDDRARIQVGRISGFGLMEMSRQRLRTGVLEASTRACPHCEGTGLVRTASSAGLSALRMLEEEAARGRGSIITLRASQEAAFYVLNNKRRELGEIESRYGVTIGILPDGEVEGARMSVEASGPKPTQVITFAPLPIDVEEDVEEEEIFDEIEEDFGEEGEAPRDSAAAGNDGRSKRKRRRRGRRGRRDGEGETAPGGETMQGDLSAAVDTDTEGEGEGDPDSAQEAFSDGQDGADGDARRKGRRGRRGGRRRRGAGDGREDAVVGVAPEGEADNDVDEPLTVAEGETQPEVAGEPDVTGVSADDLAEPVRKTRRRPRARKVDETQPAVDATADAGAPVDLPTETEAPKPKRRSRAKADEMPDAAPTAEAPGAEADAEAPKPKRRTRAKKADVAVDVATAEVDSETPVAPAGGDEVMVDAGAGGQVEGEAVEDGAAPRRGWWQRTFGA